MPKAFAVGRTLGRGGGAGGEQKGDCPHHWTNVAKIFVNAQQKRFRLTIKTFVRFWMNWDAEWTFICWPPWTQFPKAREFRCASGKGQIAKGLPDERQFRMVLGGVGGFRKVSELFLFGAGCEMYKSICAFASDGLLNRPHNNGNTWAASGRRWAGVSQVSQHSKPRAADWDLHECVSRKRRLRSSLSLPCAVYELSQMTQPTK